jgi:hypothetical protein
MKTNTIANFYADYCATVKKLVNGIGEFRKLDKSYGAVDLGSSITDGTDFGESAFIYSKLYMFFAVLRELVTTQILAAMYEHIQIITYYELMGLANLIGDTDEMGDGNTGLALKNAITSMVDLNTFLSAGHYTNLCRMEYTSERPANAQRGINWEYGITGGQVKSVISSLEALDMNLLSGLDYSKLYQLI